MGAKHTQYGPEHATECGVDSHLRVQCHVDETTLITSDDALIRTLELRGVPFETTSDDDLEQWKIARNKLFQGIQQPGLSLWVHLVREQQDEYPEGDCKSAFARQIDKEYKAVIKGSIQYANRLYVSIAQRPPLQKARGILKRLGADLDGINYVKRLADLNEVTQTLVEGLSRYEPRILSTYEYGGLTYSEPLEFLGRIVNGTYKRKPLTKTNASLSLLDVQLQFGKDTFLQRGIEDHRYGGMLAIKEYASDTQEGMLDALMTIPAELVVSQSFTFMSKTAASELLRKQQTQMISAGDLGLSQIEQIDQAQDDLTSNRFSLGHHHLTVSTTGQSAAEVAKNLALCQTVLMEGPTITSAKERLGLEAAFWAQIPGNTSYVTRGTPVTSVNFASFASFHNAPGGRASGNHWGNAVAQFRTPSNTPYYFNFHYPADLGNSLVIGPSGGGKTVLVLFLLAQLEKLDVTRIYFDKDRGAEVGIRAMGGVYSTLQAGVPTGLNPCQLSDTPANRAFLGEWLSILGRNGLGKLPPGEVAEIKQAVEGNYSLPVEDRNLSAIFAYFQAGEPGCLRDRLEEWLSGNTRGWVFDNPKDSLSLGASLQGFDVTEFLGDPQVRTAVLLYLLHRINELLDGRRICLSFDEGWRLLDDPIFSGMLQDWLKVIRKKNGFTLFATQEPDDVLGSSIAGTLISQSPTQIFLPNSKATRATYIDGFRLTEKEYTIIQELGEDSRCFLVKQGQNSSVVNFNLKGMDDAIKVLSGTAESVQALDAIRSEVGDTPADWLPIFLEES